LICKAASNPIFRAPASIIEFGVAVASSARLNPDKTTLAKGFAVSKTALCLALPTSIEQSDEANARRVMAEIPALDAPA